MEDKELLFRAAGMSEMNKNALICRLYGLFEIAEARNNPVSAEYFFKVLEEEVDSLTK